METLTKRMSAVWFVFAAFVPTAICIYPFQNTSLPWNDRVDDLVNRLTVDEIVGQLSHGGLSPKAGPTPPIDRLGIKPYSWNTECLGGDSEAGNATSFPQSIGMAATFSREVIFAVAEATSIEVRAKYNNYSSSGEYGTHRGLSCFSPVVNIMRHPLWGRNQETYGEDPYLSGQLAGSFVTGLQGDDPRYVRASAGCKHFDVHNGPENIPVSRFSFDAIVSERDWRTTFLPQFKACIDAGTHNLMCSYNKINGIPACANQKLLTSIAREEMGFTGYFISDQGAVENIISAHKYFNNSVDTAAGCLNAGLNLELSNSIDNNVFTYLGDALNAGKIDKSTLYERAKPLFYTRMRLGEFDPAEMDPYSKLDLSVVQSEEHRSISLDAALRSFVLLRNDGVLPLKTLDLNVALVGPMADNPSQQFGDYSADMESEFTTTPLSSLKSVFSQVTHESGCVDNKCAFYYRGRVKKAVESADLVVVFLGTGNDVESEGNDRANMELPGFQAQLLYDVVEFTQGSVVLFLFNAGPVNITFAKYHPRISAIVECFFPAQATGDAVKALLSNSPIAGSNPGGRLPFTWPASLNDVPPITNYSMVNRTYRYFEGVPLYPFGYGLSFSAFAYNGITLNQSIHVGDNLTVSVTVKNLGPYDGDEVTQAYLQWLNASVLTPHLQLVGFERNSLRVGEQRQVQFTVTSSQMAVYVEDKGFIVEPGPMRIYVGGQQPNQETHMDSNVLQGNFTIVGQSKLIGQYI